MADVYLATDLRHDRSVAIKVMRRETVGAAGRHRFLREISIAAKLSHPNIVPLFDSGEIGEAIYYVMPFIEGPSLRERLIRDGRLDLDDALAITTEVADALSHAHQRGIVHRDIKPGNILIEAGHARVTDFGVAKALEAAGTDSLTSGALAVGTLAYMSPEQASNPTTVDARCDVYALALVLYEMLSGDVAFQASTPDAMLAAKALAQFRPLRETRDDIPQQVDRAIARALEPDPSKRVASVAEFIAILRDPDSPEAQGRSARQRRRRYTVIAGAGIVVMSVAIALSTANKRDRAANAGVPAAGLGRIVVAPLLNGTEDKSLDVVGLMAGDWLTEGLQKTGILEVVPTLGVFEIDSITRRVRAPSRVLAEETGAGTVVSGAYYQRRDSLLFRLQVADQGGTRVAGTITDVATPTTDPIRGLEELRNRLMGWLSMHYDERLQLPKSGAEKPPTFEAFRAFSDGMTLYISTQNARALPLFLEAYRLDSSFVAALLYATLSLTNVDEWARADSLLRIVDERRNVLSPYDRALLDYRLGIIRGNGELALSASRTASRLAPASKAVYNHAVAAFQNGYIHEALSTIESIQPDRGSMRGFASYWSIYGSIVHALGDYDREQGIGNAARAAYPQRLMAFPPLLRALAARGRLSEIDAALRQARTLPPDPYFYWDHGALLIETAEELRAHGRPRDAARYFTELRDWAAARDSVPRMKWRVVQALYALGRWPEASSTLATLRHSDPENVDYVGMTGLLHSRMGRRAEAMLIADTLARRRKPYELGMPSTYRARIAATLGDRDLAVEALLRAFAEERPFQVWVHRDIDLESLRGYAPFQRILRGKD